MENVDGSSSSSSSSSTTVVQAEAGGDQMDLRKGPWTVEEDLFLVNYIAVHGDRRWNSLARSAGLRRSGKSCRLRWLNYLRPDVRRGNITPEEELLILELHSRWGNRWSKIAQHLPGRTDNEIKNYWRTRVQKHAKQLKCDVNSQQFKEAVRRLWMPRLMEKIQAATPMAPASVTAVTSTVDVASTYVALPTMTAEAVHNKVGSDAHVINLSPDHSSAAVATTSSDSSGGTWLSSPPASDLTDCYLFQEMSSSSDYGGDEFPAGLMVSSDGGSWLESLLIPSGFLQQTFPELEQIGWGADGGFSSENLWAADDIWL